MAVSRNRTSILNIVGMQPLLQVFWLAATAHDVLKTNKNTQIRIKK